MALSLTVYNFSKKKNSTNYPTSGGQTFDNTGSNVFKLNDDTSIYNPVFTLGISGSIPVWSYAKFDVSTSGSSRIFYYYITDIIKGNTDLVEIHCELDPLATASSDIFATTTWVSRTTDSSYQNIWYIDDEVSVLPYAVDVSQGSYNPGLTDNNGCYIMRVVGKDGIDTFILDESELHDALNFMFTDGTYLDGVQDSLVKAVVNPFQYIVSFKYTPLKYSVLASGIPSPAPLAPLYYGFWLCNVVDGQGNLVKFHKAAYTGMHFGPYTLNNAPAFFNDFGDYDPNITKAHIVLPGGAVYEIPNSWLAQTLKLEIAFDIITGQCQYIITDNGGYILANFSSQICFEVQIGQSATDLGALASGAIGAAVSAMAGSPLGVAASLTGAVKAALQPNPSVNGTQQTAAFIKAEPNVKIIATRYGTSATPGNIGKPCNQNLTLSSLAGEFVMCPQATVDTKLPQQYKDVINNTLASGIWLE